MMDPVNNTNDPVQPVVNPNIPVGIPQNIPSVAPNPAGSLIADIPVKRFNIFIKIATFYPILYLIFFFLSLLFLIPLLLAITKSVIAGIIYFCLLIPLHILVFVDMIYLLIYYLRDVSKNSKIPDNKKMVWKLAVFFGNIIVFPIYWNKFVKK